MRNLNIRLDPETLEAVDKARGYEPRSSFIRRKLRRILKLPEEAAAAR